MTDEIGNPLTRQTLGYAVFTTMLLVLTVQIGLHSNTVTKVNAFCTYVMPVASFYLICYGYSAVSPDTMLLEV